MDTLPLDVAALYADERTPEQRAAHEWCAGWASVEPVALSAVAAGEVALASFDVCWWHRDRPLAWLETSDPDPAECADAIGSFLEAGGGLAVTLHALSAVVPLGIDPVAPDATGHETPPAPSGYLAKSLHADHPVFEALDGPAVHTRAADADTAFARYESVLPARGDVLAAGVRGDDLLVGHSPLVEWRVGDGRVIGAGAALSFSDPREYEAAAAQERLVGNALATLGSRRWPATTTRPDDAAGMARLRGRLAGDHHRPRAHVSPPANWLNDPNGLLYRDGTYHVFYQYNPGGPYHGSIHWGHATSDDLVAWRDEPVALAPDPDGPDRDGCWSGCAVVDDDGTSTLLYTGGRHRQQLPCLATAGDDGLRTWTKDPRNPIIESAPDGVDVLETDDWEAEFRDHCVWREDGSWYQLVGSGIAGAGGAALLYRADRLDEWEFVGPLLVGEEGDGAVWECPELLAVGDRHLLHVSANDTVRYFLGELDLSEPSFEVERRGRLDHGEFYAPQSLAGPDGRSLTWGWLPEARDVSAQWEAGWSGCLSVPRVLDVEDGRLRQRPAAELTGLRERRVADSALDLAAGDHRRLPWTGTRLEVALSARRESGATFELGVFESPAGTERTALRWTDDDLVLDRSRSSLDSRASREERRLPLPASDANADPDDLSLRLFLDGSVVEAFANDRRCLTGRVYPTRRDAEGLSLTATGGAVAVESLEAWELGVAFRADEDGRGR
jgi:beta-fructofuranosidase